MKSSLKNLYSIINNKLDAKDNERSFTFIEFIKEFGFENSPYSFLNYYKNYLTEWSKTKELYFNSSDNDIVKESLINTLKSIILTYSSYEEQDFIANLNWNNEDDKIAIIPFFAEKIKNICDFYKIKRQEIPLTINKNNIKGSRTSLEQIIFDKIIDFYLENKNLAPQIEEIKKNLNITLEQYIDLYSDYFDIPNSIKINSANTKSNDFLNITIADDNYETANINVPDYKDYVKLNEAISNILFDGSTFLEEIPLIAQIGLDFNQQCVGDVALLRDKLLNESTSNLISLNDQISIRRKLYEKYLGCDLYYIYCESPNNIFIDVLTKAENPSGNLLNAKMASAAIIEPKNINENLKLLSQIGLFFKPDKIGILKINSDNFTWKIDSSKLQSNTFYVFPDPNKYGDIGNNKSIDYPLIYEFKLDSYIKNLSSGKAKNEPLVHLAATSLNTYYSNQDRDFILNNNKNYDYSFTGVEDKGDLINYQTDIFANEYGLFYDSNNNTYNLLVKQNNEIKNFSEVSDKSFVDDKLIIKNYAIFNEILIIEAENESKPKIYFYKILPNNYKIIEESEIKKDSKYKILYNETKNILIIAILYKDSLNLNLSLDLYKFDILSEKSTKIFDEPKILPFVNESSEDLEMDNFVFTYNNQLDKYLLICPFYSLEKFHLYQYQFKLNSKEIFESTLKSELIKLDKNG